MCQLGRHCAKPCKQETCRRTQRFVIRPPEASAHREQYERHAKNTHTPPMCRHVCMLVWIYGLCVFMCVVSCVKRRQRYKQTCGWYWRKRQLPGKHSRIKSQTSQDRVRPRRMDRDFLFIVCDFSGSCGPHRRSHLCYFN